MNVFKRIPDADKISLELSSFLKTVSVSSFKFLSSETHFLLNSHSKHFNNSYRSSLFLRLVCRLRLCFVRRLCFDSPCGCYSSHDNLCHFIQKFHLEGSGFSFHITTGPQKICTRYANNALPLRMQPTLGCFERTRSCANSFSAYI